MPVVVQEECTAADAARLRLHERQHHLNRDGCIDGIPAFFQDTGTGCGGKWVGSGDCFLAKRSLLFRRQTA
ncbi:hypothetical protein NBRC116584_33590 [Hydrogenophaga sp. 5NK40-0174]